MRKEEKEQREKKKLILIKCYTGQFGLRVDGGKFTYKSGPHSDQIICDI